MKEERTTHTLLSRSFRSFPFPFAQFNSRLHFFSLQLNWSERRERGKRGVRRMKREKTQVKSERGVHFIYPLSLIHLFFCSSLTILSGELLSEGWVKGTEVKWKGKWRMTARLSLLFISLSNRSFLTVTPGSLVNLIRGQPMPGTFLRPSVTCQRFLFGLCSICSLSFN